MTEGFDFKEAFGQALVTKFFEPVPIGGNMQTGMQYAPSGVSLLAQELYRQHAIQLMESLWVQIDVDDLAKKVADKVVRALLDQGTTFSPNRQMDTLKAGVMKYVAEQLGQRVVEQMDVQLGSKTPEIEEKQ